MSSVRKRVLPSGDVRWQVDYKDHSGKRRHKQFERKREAEAYETRVRSELAAGIHVADAASATIAQAGELWIERAEEIEQLETSTVKQYRQHLKHHIIPLLGGVKLSRLTKPAVEEFRDQLLRSRSKPLARAVLTSLKGILKEAQRRGLVGQNVAADTKVNLKKRERPEIEIPSKDEIRAILLKSADLWPLTRIRVSRKGDRKSVADARRPLIVTAIFTGLRCSELRGLSWTNVDFGCWRDQGSAASRLPELHWGAKIAGRQS